MEIGHGANIGGRYLVQRELGRGGFATVFAATHTTLGSTHALKILHTATPTLSQRLLSEGRAQAQLQHPNIVAVTDVVQLEQHVVLVMEFIDGPSLDTVLSARRLSLGEIDLIVRALLSGVAAAHERGLVHRDLKPANVLISCAGAQVQPKITDFGLVKVLDADGAGLTASGVGMGTPAYMAPEQFTAASAVDERCDIYSLGCILYELCSGRRATIGDGVFQLALIAETADRPALSELSPETPPRLVALIEQTLSPQPDHRPGSVAEMLERWTAASTSEPDAHRTLADLAAGAAAVFARQPTNSTLTSLTGGHESVPGHGNERMTQSMGESTVAVALHDPHDIAFISIGLTAGLVWAAIMLILVMWLFPASNPHAWPFVSRPQVLFLIPLGFAVPALAGAGVARFRRSSAAWVDGLIVGGIAGVTCFILAGASGALLLGTRSIYALAVDGAVGDTLVTQASVEALIGVPQNLVVWGWGLALLGAGFGAGGASATRIHAPQPPRPIRTRPILWFGALAMSVPIYLGAYSVMSKWHLNSFEKLAQAPWARETLRWEQHVSFALSLGTIAFVVVMAATMAARSAAFEWNKSDFVGRVMARVRIVAALAVPVVLAVHTLRSGMGWAGAWPAWTSSAILVLALPIGLAAARPLLDGAHTPVVEDWPVFHSLAGVIGTILAGGITVVLSVTGIYVAWVVTAAVLVVGVVLTLAIESWTSLPRVFAASLEAAWAWTAVQVAGFVAPVVAMLYVVSPHTLDATAFDVGSMGEMRAVLPSIASFLFVSHFTGAFLIFPAALRDSPATVRTQSNIKNVVFLSVVALAALAFYFLGGLGDESPNPVEVVLEPSSVSSADAGFPGWALKESRFVPAGALQPETRTPLPQVEGFEALDLTTVKCQVSLVISDGGKTRWVSAAGDDCPVPASDAISTGMPTWTWKTDEAIRTRFDATFDAPGDQP